MKKTHIKMLVFGSCILIGGIVFAQNGDDQFEDPPPPPPRHHRPPPPLILLAIDANHDRVIDASEIADASAALLKLDKNGDGQLTMDELCPRCPEPGHMPDHEGPPPPFEPNP